MIGSFVLNLSFFSSLFASAVTVLALKFKDEELLEGGRWAFLSTFVLSSIACFRLIYAFVRDEFAIKYVASNSTSDLPLFYKIAALWAGQEGSLLLWFWLLTLFSALLILKREGKDEILDHSLPVLAFTQLFFSLLLILPCKPFRKLPIAPEDGWGLNPLLQNPNMLLHPPTLYAGYVGFTIPFAFGIGALLSGRGDAEWAERCRAWTILSWIFLTLGIIFGAKWAYVELGWGGYWAWDPVENASLMPWLTATAFLHSIMVQERRNMFRLWNISLITLTFELCIFGTFLTRSGIVGSVHSFARSSLGYYFIAFIGLSVITVFLIVYIKRGLIRDEKSIDSTFSKEGLFLMNNLLLCALCFATFIGTIFPLISEIFTGRRLTVGPSFFNRVNAPLAVFLLLLTGICSSFRRNLFILLPISALISIPFGLKLKSLYPMFGIFFGSFVLLSIISEFYRTLKSSNSLRPFLRNRRRYGGYIVHLGVAILFIGMASSSLKSERTVEDLKLGESFNLEGYTFKFDGISSERGKNFMAIAGRLKVLKGGKEIYELSPRMAYYPKADEITFEVDVKSGFFKDIYAIMTDSSERKRACFKVYIIPMMRWIWMGCWIMLIGSAFALSHRVKSRRIYNRGKNEGSG